MPEHSYPPVGDPDRFSSIVARGSSLRRRRRAATGLGAGGGLAAIAAVVVLTVGGPGGTPVVADSADGATPTSIETPVAETTVASGELTVTVGVEHTDEGAQSYFVLVDDPQQPVSDLSQQCVFVSVHERVGGDPVAQGHNCHSDAQSEPAVLAVAPMDSEIGCAAWEVRDSPEPTSVAPVSTRFELDVSALPIPEHNEYFLEVTASSGPGDGCNHEPAEHERRATLAAPVSIVVE